MFIAHVCEADDRLCTSYPLDPDAFFMAGLGPAHIEARHAQYKSFEKFLAGLTGKGSGRNGCDTTGTFPVARVDVVRYATTRVYALRHAFNPQHKANLVSTACAPPSRTLHCVFASDPSRRNRLVRRQLDQMHASAKTASAASKPTSSAADSTLASAAVAPSSTVVAEASSVSTSAAVEGVEKST